MVSEKTEMTHILPKILPSKIANFIVRKFTNSKILDRCSTKNF